MTWPHRPLFRIVPPVVDHCRSPIGIESPRDGVSVTVSGTACDGMSATRAGETSMPSMRTTTGRVDMRQLSVKTRAIESRRDNLNLKFMDFPQKKEKAPQQSLAARQAWRISPR